MRQSRRLGRGTCPVDKYGVRNSPTPRRGAASLDYILVVGVILPLALIVIPVGRRIIQLVYEMICVMIAWPFV